jgi:hypothetical protein
MLLAWLVLATGLTISAVAIYYSIVGLATIFSAAIIPIMIMGGSLEVGKLVTAVWLHRYWYEAPKTLRAYLCVAVVILMLITSLGIFGFLSRAHSDQNLVSGEVQSKIALYDEKIRISKDNIDANRRALKQLDEAVDQVMGRSTTETGAERAVQIRRQQGPERQRLLREIETEQKKISKLNEERAPIAAEVRKVEAEVGPIKYVAQFIYGETDQGLLEKAVVWMIIIIIIVFDPLAVLLLIASQMTFAWQRKLKSIPVQETAPAIETPPIQNSEPEKPVEPVIEKSILEQHPYLNKGFKYPEGWRHEPLVYKPEQEEQPAAHTEPITVPEPPVPAEPELVEEEVKKKKYMIKDSFNNLLKKVKKQ